MENDRLNEIRELNPDYDISMHELDVCVGDNQYRLMYYVYVQHKESGIGVYGDKDFDMQEVINRLPIKFTIEKEHSIIPKGVHIKICDFSSSRGVTWSQLLEVGIDNADDLYWWYVTFSIDTTAI